MNLFINAVSSNGKLILFDNNKIIISDKDIFVLGNESSKLTSIIDDFLNENNIKYPDLGNIVVVSGPGSFTGVRAVSLMVNTIAFTCKVSLTDISFFDLFHAYPIVKSSSKRDLFVKKNKLDIITIIKNEDFRVYLEENKINTIYGDISNIFDLDNIILNTDIDYIKIIKDIEFLDKKIINPLYVKKPNIS